MKYFTTIIPPLCLIFNELEIIKKALEVSENLKSKSITQEKDSSRLEDLELDLSEIEDAIEKTEGYSVLNSDIVIKFDYFEAKQIEKALKLLNNPDDVKSVLKKVQALFKG